MVAKEYDTALLLNMQMVEDDLEDLCNVLYFYRHHDESRLTGASVYYGQKELSQTSVYVARAEVFDRHAIGQENICLVSVGALKHRPQGCSIIEVDGSVQWEEVFNGVLHVFSRYLSWAQKLFYILNNGGGLFELCVAALDFFRNPLYIHDENFNVLAMPMWVVGMTKLHVDESSGNTTVPMEKVQQLNQNPDYIKTLTTHGAQMWNPSYNAHRVVYTNIWVHGKYCGRFLINELSASLKPSDFLMAEYFVQMLSLAFERNLFKSSAASSFEKILQQVQSGQTSIDRYFLDRLRMVGWSPDNQYICFATELVGSAADILTSKRACSALGVLLKWSFSFYIDTTVFTLYNLSRSGDDETGCERKMRSFCSMYAARVGASSPFGDIRQLREAFLQGEKAIELGRLRKSGDVYLPFSRYALDYILHHFLEEFSLQSVCAPAILQLQALDAEKQTDYIRTLRCFFDSGCQQTATAQAMFIHRSTLDYRLKKIQELTGAVLSDPDTRLYLQISIRLLECD